MARRAERREIARASAHGWRVVLLLVAAYAAACAVALALGFDHISDDDFARVTIAQAFAHRPRLDPSGTSWLPAPFWALGSVMLVFGRSLAVARWASVAMASLAAALPYLALRGTGATRGRALGAAAFAMLSPWSVWLGAATVPEAVVASATAGAAIALGARAGAGAGARAGARAGAGAGARAGAGAGARALFAVAMFAACLSRYEPWPVAAVLAVVLARRAWTERSAGSIACVVLVAAGPLLWIGWNAYAHGDALHFFARVSRFKQSIGEGSVDTVAALLLYPRLLVTTRPDVVLAVTCAGAAAWKLLDREEVRARWTVPLICTAAQIAFLAYGNARDGAPAHHAERALLGATFILAAFAADVLAAAAPVAWARGRAPAIGGVAVVLLGAWAFTTLRALGDVPGAGPTEDRAPQIARGNALRAARATELVVTPCAYEHFALIAAYGAPERVETRPRADDAGTATGPGTATCPAVERR